MARRLLYLCLVAVHALVVTTGMARPLLPVAEAPSSSSSQVKAGMPHGHEQSLPTPRPVRINLWIPTGTGQSQPEEGSGIATEKMPAQQENKRHDKGECILVGAIILGGLATIAFAVLFCYIRATRSARQNDDITEIAPQVKTQA